MTCREHIFKKFGEEVGKRITEEYCPSSFGFDDKYECGEDCCWDICWGSEQSLPKNFDKQCSRFDVENMKFIDTMTCGEAFEALQQEVYNTLGVPESILNTDENKKLCEKHRGMMTPEEPHILDSGDRTEFESGAVRDMRVGKGRCDLLPLDVVSAYINDAPHDQDSLLWAVYKFQETNEIPYLYSALDQFRSCQAWCPATLFLEVAKHFEEGAKKYGDDNWKKGIPTNVYINSAVRHYLKFLRGDKDEPHDRAFCWNILCCIWTCIHKPELNVYRNLEKGE